MRRMRVKPGATIWDPSGEWDYFDLPVNAVVRCEMSKATALCVPAEYRFRGHLYKGLVSVEDIIPPERRSHDT